MKRKVPYLKLFFFTVPRRRGIAARLAVLSLVLAAIAAAWCLADLTSQVLLPPQPILALDHYAINRSLKSYLDNISVLIEPSSTVCSDNKRVDVLVLVTSSPKRFAQRQAIRDTWGKYVPAYFVLGLDGPAVEDLTADNYLEAKAYGDMIIFQFLDHYQNLTLKSALMMQWTAARCPSHLDELMLFKTDDDVLVNPWVLRRVVQQNSGKDLIGSRLEEILQAAFEVPIINLEDVYFTYIVSKIKLNLTLTHDRRLSPYKPWLPLDCIYWGLASTHSLTPNEILGAWPSIERLGKRYEHGFDNCLYFVNNIWTELYLY
ncbi:beta-1,3-galactosyltransferase 5-like isoform X3 [Maniola jurtina]|uniref:beta-1,3-galactosyltransferase 5-like isoform X3 n=1 Tax=Maniola jurtina TaxID=191418 RepID=UPI001E685DD3|nr:beta-1,3-galactosyltransferase 5-like isoform X3 [Maniola jurtina]